MKKLVKLGVHKEKIVIHFNLESYIIILDEN
jgi:hypothetical protein